MYRNPEQYKLCTRFRYVFFGGYHGKLRNEVQKKENPMGRAFTSSSAVYVSWIFDLRNKQSPRQP